MAVVPGSVKKLYVLSETADNHSTLTARLRYSRLIKTVGDDEI